MCADGVGFNVNILKAAAFQVLCSPEKLAPYIVGPLKLEMKIYTAERYMNFLLGNVYFEMEMIVKHRDF